MVAVIHREESLHSASAMNSSMAVMAKVPAICHCQTFASDAVTSSSNSYSFQSVSATNAPEQQVMHCSSWIRNTGVCRGYRIMEDCNNMKLKEAGKIIESHRVGLNLHLYCGKVQLQPLKQDHKKQQDFMASGWTEAVGMDNIHLPAMDSQNLGHIHSLAQSKKQHSAFNIDIKTDVTYNSSKDIKSHSCSRHERFARNSSERLDHHHHHNGFIVGHNPGHNSSNLCHHHSRQSALKGRIIRLSRQRRKLKESVMLLLLACLSVMLPGHVNAHPPDGKYFCFLDQRSSGTILFIFNTKKTAYA